MLTYLLSILKQNRHYRNKQSWVQCLGASSANKNSSVIALSIPGSAIAAVYSKSRERIHTLRPSVLDRPTSISQCYQFHRTAVLSSTAGPTRYAYDRKQTAKKSRKFEQNNNLSVQLHVARFLTSIKNQNKSKAGASNNRKKQKYLKKSACVHTHFERFPYFIH